LDNIDVMPAQSTFEETSLGMLEETLEEMFES
jgi:hypothetical protein